MVMSWRPISHLRNNPVPLTPGLDPNSRSATVSPITRAMQREQSKMANQHRMPTHHPRIFGTKHMVASANYLAAQTGFEILEAGGNAIDAGVAAGIALGVLQCEYVHFGGVAPIMIQLAETGETVSISGLGPWPKLASAAWFREHQGGRILSNIKRSVIPAAPDSWITALELYGTMSFADVAAAAIRLGREGFGFQSISHEVMSESADTIA